MLTEAAIVIPDEQEDEVEKFREFLEQVSPEDFAGLRSLSRTRRGVVVLRRASNCPQGLAL